MGLSDRAGTAAPEALPHPSSITRFGIATPLQIERLLYRTIDRRRAMRPIEPGDAHNLAIKVPVVIAINFSSIKILAATVDETETDSFIFNLHVGLAATSLAMGLLLAVFPLLTGERLLAPAAHLRVTATGQVVPENPRSAVEVSSPPAAPAPGFRSLARIHRGHASPLGCLRIQCPVCRISALSQLLTLGSGVSAGMNRPDRLMV